MAVVPCESRGSRNKQPFVSYLAVSMLGRGIFGWKIIAKSVLIAGVVLAMSAVAT